MSSELRLSPEWSDDVLCVEITGGLAAATVDCFDRRIDEAIRDAGHSARAVVLDCEKLDRVTGIGWHHVLLLARSLGRRGATLHLAALPPDLQDVFRDVSFRGLLTIHRSNTEAMTALL